MSTLHLCCISVDRYCAIIKPFEYRHFMNSRWKAMICCCFFLALYLHIWVGFCRAVILAVRLGQTGQKGQLGQSRQTRQTSQRRLTGQTDLRFKLDFSGNLWGAAFAILAMFSILPPSNIFLPSPVMLSFPFADEIFSLSKTNPKILFWLNTFFSLSFLLSVLPIPRTKNHFLKDGSSHSFSVFLPQHLSILMSDLWQRWLQLHGSVPALSLLFQFC